MRLRAIETVSFRNSERTNYDKWAKAGGTLASGDVVLFVSLGGEQLVFVSKPVQINMTAHGGVGTREVLFSQRLRVAGGTWNPLMLANYAEQVGLQLDGLPRFEAYYRKLHPRAR